MNDGMDRPEPETKEGTLSKIPEEIIKAIKKNNIQLIKKLLENGGDINKIFLIDGKELNPLMYASYKGFIEIMKILIQKGADVNLQTPKGFTSLMRAVNSNIEETVNLLLDNGANVNLKDYQGTIALYYTIRNNNTNIADILLKKGADINTQDKDGDTLLHNSIFEEKPEMVEFFLQKGINVNLKNKNGKTPLIEAAYIKNIDIVKMLCRAGANINIQDINGKTPLQHAVHEKNVKMIKFLLEEERADINIKDKFGNRVLFYTIENKKIEYNRDIANYLIDHGADINEINNAGETLLYNAINSKNIGMVEFLVEKGVDTTKKIKDKLPIDIALQNIKKIEDERESKIQKLKEDFKKSLNKEILKEIKIIRSEESKEEEEKICYAIFEYLSYKRIREKPYDESKSKSESDFECPICFEQLKSNKKVVPKGQPNKTCVLLRECGHYICYDCYEKLLDKKICPICRGEIKKISYSYYYNVKGWLPDGKRK